ANFVPILGPIFSGFILVLVAFIYSLKQAILVLILFVIIQQIEGNLISPILINKFLNLPPYLVLLSLLIGGKLMGITGAILFLPLFGAIFNFSKKIYLH
ncbi:AI-2E family transporter, partial [Candidatus Parcubacteria bacterium]|nr:AI-2E family transporter [Candidatus Parcubacteria bacterium]